MVSKYTFNKNEESGWRLSLPVTSFFFKSNDFCSIFCLFSSFIYTFHLSFVHIPRGLLLSATCSETVLLAVLKNVLLITQLFYYVALVEISTKELI